MASEDVVDNLTEVEAKARGAAVSNVTYNVDLSFVRGATEYQGTLVLKFNHKKSDGDVFLDVISKTINKVTLNGKDAPVDAAAISKNNRLYLSKDSLADSNELRVEFTNEYDTTGNGLHHFVDPEDNQEYLYSNFEPFYCHRMFPCFDQPDIKAKLELTVSAPTEWLVISNEKEAKAEALSDGRSVHHFAQTPPLSTYLYALVVGPYAKYEDKHDNIVLGFYVRKSLSQFFKPDLEELLTITKQGLKFYTEFFNCPYPFTKYDQIFCPEYNMGAMENPGAVTFTESYVYRDPPTDDQRLRRADTFLHEMAHMWFGDLVSPVWWDGLWLNESFASYMAALAVAEATRFGPKSWLEFHTAYKRWAYREDQLSTTHSIQGQVIDTNSTFQNFDGITYGKGASVLKQLVAVVGMSGFKAGMQHYFKKHAWGNTTIGDFLSAIEVGAKKSLTEWSKPWLEIAGLNTLNPVWTAENGKITSFVVEQTAEAPHTTLRPHHLEIALFDAKADGVPQYRSSAQVDISGAKTSLDSLVGQPTPACVFINNNDQAYAKVLLDKVSLEYFKNNVEKFDDTLMRQLVWSSLLTMVRDAQLPAQELLDLITNKVSYETDPKMVQFIIRAAEASLASFLPDELIVEKSTQFFELCVKMLNGAKTQDEQIVWARAAIGAARSKATVEKLITLVDKGTGLPGFELDQDMRWSITQRAAAYAIEGADARAAKEDARDPSDRGKRAMEKFKVCAPDAAVKEAAWNRFTTDTKSSMKMLNAAMGGFQWRHQRDILDPYVDKFFSTIHEICKTREFAAAENFYNILFPGHRVDDDVLQRCQTLLAKLDTVKDSILVRCLKESIDDIKRSQQCHALARKYASSKH